MKGILGLLVFVIISLNVSAQSSIPKAQAMFIYNFCRLIEWPETYRTGTFVVGVIGNSPTYNEINTFIAGKKIGTQSVLIKKYESAGQIDKCHVLFVPFNQTKNMSEIMTKVGANSTLIIGEKGDAITKGAIISFNIVADKLKFEIKPSNAKSRKINISSKLTTMAYKVH